MVVGDLVICRMIELSLSARSLPALGVSAESLARPSSPSPGLPPRPLPNETHPKVKVSSSIRFPSCRSRMEDDDVDPAFETWLSQPPSMAQPSGSSSHEPDQDGRQPSYTMSQASQSPPPEGQLALSAAARRSQRQPLSCVLVVAFLLLGPTGDELTRMAVQPH